MPDYSGKTKPLLHRLVRKYLKRKVLRELLFWRFAIVEVMAKGLEQETVYWQQALLRPLCFVPVSQCITGVRCQAPGQSVTMHR